MALAGDHVQVLVGGYDLTGDSNNIGISEARDMYDVTAFSDAVHLFIPGRPTTTLDHAGYLNAAAARSHPVLKAVTVEGVVSVLVGENAAPAVGNLMFSLGAVQGQYQSLMEANKFVPFAAKFAAKGLSGGWGRALAPLVTITGTATGPSVDNGTQTTRGGAAFLHILQVGGDTYSILIQGSTTGAFSGEESTIALFTLNASALGSQRVDLMPGVTTIPRYTRWKATRISGATNDPVKLAINLVRF